MHYIMYCVYYESCVNGYIFHKLFFIHIGIFRFFHTIFYLEMPAGIQYVSVSWCLRAHSCISITMPLCFWAAIFLVSLISGHCQENIFIVTVPKDAVWNVNYRAWQDGSLVISRIFASSGKKSDSVLWPPSPGSCSDENSWQRCHCFEFRNRWELTWDW